jgi:hypothetical protein
MAQRRLRTCPPWCGLDHGEIDGEDDQIHLAERPAGNMWLRLCATIDPSTGEQDGPYVLLGTQELTLDQAQEYVDVLTSLITEGCRSDALRNQA